MASVCLLITPSVANNDVVWKRKKGHIICTGNFGPPNERVKSNNLLASPCVLQRIELEQNQIHTIYLEMISLPFSIVISHLKVGAAVFCSQTFICHNFSLFNLSCRLGL